jgi:hypothetical protein
MTIHGVISRVWMRTPCHVTLLAEPSLLVGGGAAATGGMDAAYGGGLRLSSVRCCVSVLSVNMVVDLTVDTFLFTFWKDKDTKRTADDIKKLSTLVPEFPWEFQDLEACHACSLRHVYA